MSVTVPILAAMVDIRGGGSSGCRSPTPTRRCSSRRSRRSTSCATAAATRRRSSPPYFDAPMGAFFVGYLDDVPVATGAWRRRTDVEFDGHLADRRDQADVRRAGCPPRRARPGDARPPRGDRSRGRSGGDGARDRDAPARGDHPLRVGGLHARAGVRLLQGLAALAVLRAQPGGARLLRAGRAPEGWAPARPDGCRRSSRRLLGRFTQLLCRGVARRPQESSPIQGG